MERLFRLPTTGLFALQPEGDLLIASLGRNACSVVDGITGEQIACLSPTAISQLKALGLSACGQFAILSDGRQVIVQHIASGTVQWRRDVCADELIPNMGGREWAFVRRSIRRNSRAGLEMWRWPFHTEPEYTRDWTNDAFFLPIFRGQRIAVDDSRGVDVRELGDSHASFSVTTAGRPRLSWRHDGSLVVVHEASLPDFTWFVDLYDLSGQCIGRTESHTMVTGVSASPARDEVLLTYVNGIVLFPSFGAFLREHDAIPQPFAPREVHADTYAFSTVVYPEEAESPEEVDADSLDELVEALEPFHRDTWLPQTKVGREAIGGSKFGGVPWLNAGEAWPRCGQCGGLMDLYLQINGDLLPSSGPRSFGGLLQVFLCNYESPIGDICQNLAPFSNAALVRICHPSGEPAYTDLADGDLFDEVSIVGWELRRDFPTARELLTLGIALADEQEELLQEGSIPYGGDKLLGWPAWQQRVEQHLCPHCSEVMRPIFQLDSGENIPVSLGDGGRGWVLQCPAHHDMVAFAWTF